MTATAPIGQLIERCRTGDSAAFDEIMARHQNRIYNLCYWQLSDADEAADAAQETFVRAWRSLASFRGESAFTTWLCRIALNVTYDTAKKRRRTPLPFSSHATEDDDDTPEVAAPPTEMPENVLARRERQQAVRRALSELPEHQRAVLVLFDIEGYSYEEAAALLELPLGTVKSRLSRARLALRERLETCRELFED